MRDRLKILILEDLPSDAMLVQRELKKNGLNFDCVVVDNRPDFISQLQNNLPDLVLSDYSLPQYNGMEALLDVLQLPTFMPFIIVTGSIDEETAANCIKAGATDYVTKERLVRLSSAVKGALDKKESILLQQKAEAALQESEEKFRHSFDFANIGMCLINLDGGFIKANQTLCNILQDTPEKLQSSTVFDYIEEKEAKRLNELFNGLKREPDPTSEFEMNLVKSDNQTICAYISISLVLDKKKQPIYYVAHIQDITLKKEAQERNRILSTSVEQSPASIIITDKEGLIEFVNPTFERITGYKASEAIGRNPSFLKSGVLKDEEYKILWETISSGEIWRGEFYNVKKNGDLYWEYASIAPVTNENGNITHYISSKEDITARKKMEEDLIQAKNKAEESDRLKSSFLATMSHELRTPLNSILGFSQIIKETFQTEDKQRHYGNIININGNKLLNIINDIIDISIIESTDISISNETILLTELFNKLWEKYASFDTIVNGDIKLSINIPDNLNNSEITIDDEKLFKLFTKLIDNALKFTLKGNIEFGCYNVEQNNKITFYVKDSGIGIPQKLQTIIFERFRQVEDSYTRNFGGSGLGLAICSKLIDLMKGKIWVTSEEGMGATFFFELPCVFVNQQSKDIIKPTYEESVSTITHKILVVDDSRTNIILLSEIINSLKYKSITAMNGKEALEVFMENKDISLVLLDIELPDINGIEIADKMKNLNSNIPIIAQSAYSLEGDRQKFLNAQFDDYIAKPIDFNELEKLITKHISK